MNRHLVIALALSVSAVALSSQQPKVSDTQFSTEPVGAGLSATVTRFQHSAQQLWLGYEVQSVPRHNSSSCSGSNGSDDDGCCGEYRLEGNRDSLNNAAQKTEPGRMYVLLRLDHGGIAKVRPVNAGCRLNAGGVPFTWLTGVEADDSIRYLAQLISGQTEKSNVLNGALAAIAMHLSPQATTTLASLAESSNLPWLREKAAFWLAVERGHDGFLIIKRLIHSEQDAKLREKLAFDLSISKDPESADELIALAKNDSAPNVRGQAIFWIAQKAGKKATATITNAIDNDPEQQVKKKAVFALSQLPDNEGVPQLIHVADTNQNAAVRKDAFFWLGQSKDPRALAYLESVIKR